MMAVSALFAAILFSSAFLLPARADIRVVNQCPYALTVFSRSQNLGQNQIALASGTNAQLGLPSQFIGGVLWGSPTANPNNGQATQIEFNISPTDDATRDFYDISLVNAFNENVKITPTSLASGDVASGLECGSPSCVIPDVSTLCQEPNVFAGPDNACINTDGPGLVDTPSIDLFRNACPMAFVQSNDNVNVVFGCNTGSDYDVVWCPCD